MVQEGPVHIVIDSTGLRVHSGNVPGSIPPKRRAWRKLHLIVNADTGDIPVSALTTHRARDAGQVPVLLAQVDDPLGCAMADGAYDTSSVYAAIEAHVPGPPPQTLIPPRQDAQTQSGKQSRKLRPGFRTSQPRMPWRWSTNSALRILYPSRSRILPLVVECNHNLPVADESPARRDVPSVVRHHRQRINHDDLGYFISIARLESAIVLERLSRDT